MLQNKTEDLKIAIEEFKLYINLILIKLNEIQIKNLTNETLDSIADKIHNEFIKELKQSKDLKFKDKRFAFQSIILEII